MGEPTIRRAERQDAALLLELITALANYERLDPPDEGARRSHPLVVEFSCTTHPLLRRMETMS